MKNSKKLIKIFQLPRTKIDYTGLGAPEPTAWKWVMMALLPIGLILIPNFLFDYETIPAIAEYPNFVNSLIGLAFFIGGLCCLTSWYGRLNKKKDWTQSYRLKTEIQGHVAAAGGFLGIALCGMPYATGAIFTFFISVACFLGCCARISGLIEAAYRQKVVETYDSAN